MRIIPFCRIIYFDSTNFYKFCCWKNYQKEEVRTIYIFNNIPTQSAQHSFIFYFFQHIFHFLLYFLSNCTQPKKFSWINQTFFTFVQFLSNSTQLNIFFVFPNPYIFNSFVKFFVQLKSTQHFITSCKPNIFSFLLSLTQY